MNALYVSCTTYLAALQNSLPVPLPQDGGSEAIPGFTFMSIFVGSFARGKRRYTKDRSLVAALLPFCWPQLPSPIWFNCQGDMILPGGSVAYLQGGSIRAAFVAFVFFNSIGLVASLYCVLFPATIGPWVTYQYFKQSERLCHFLYIACGALFAAYLSAVYIAFHVRARGYIFSSVCIAVCGGGVLIGLVSFRKGAAKRCQSFFKIMRKSGPKRRFREVDYRYRRWAR